MGAKTYKELDDLIEKSGYKINFIANKIGVSPVRFWKMRVDPRTISITQMEQLADICDVKFEVIYNLQKKFRIEVDKNVTRVS